MKNKKLTIISWNVAGRVKKYPQQIKAILDQNPDLIALQEIIKSTRLTWLSDLTKAGYFVQSSFDLSEDKSILNGGRKYSVIIATKWGFDHLQPGKEMVPWQERFLSVLLKSPWGPVEFHNVHMPAGVSHGVIKHMTFEGLYQYLAHQSDRMRILCGDFNSPRKEYRDGDVVVWGKVKRNKDGRLINDLSNRQASAEHGIFMGLRKYDLKDVYRQVNGYEDYDYSWMHKWKETRTYRRFDHIFASSRLKPKNCAYLHSFLEEGLSDHAPIVAVFEP